MGSKSCQLVQNKGLHCCFTLAAQTRNLVVGDDSTEYVAMMAGLCGKILWLYFSLFAVLVMANHSNNGMSVRSFKGFPSLQEVECWGGRLEPDVKLLSLNLYRMSDQKTLSYLFLNNQECLTHSEYSSCFVDKSDSRKSRVRVLVSDLEEGERRRYGCDADWVKYFERAQTSDWSIVVTRNKTTTTSTTTTTTTSTTTTTTTPRPVHSVNTKTGYEAGHVVSGVADGPDFNVSPVILIIGVCVIVFLALLCVVLIVLQCRVMSRGKSRGGHRGPNRESLLSNKSEQAGGGGCSNSSKDLDLGVTTYRSTRSFPVFSPGPTPPPAPPSQVSRGSASSGGGGGERGGGGGSSSGIMRPQRPPPDDTGYVSGSSTHYSEPYGCSSPEGTQERSGRARAGGIPACKGGSQPPRLPDNHP